MSKADEADAENVALLMRARAWLVRIRSGEATPDDLEAFERWCAERPEHARAAQTLRLTWSRLEMAISELVVEESTTARGTIGQTARLSALRPGRRAFVGFAVAAGATWLAVLPPLQLWPALGDFSADYRTGTGQQRQVALSDRVVVEMNTQTRINMLPAQASQHGIELLAGEAEIVAGAPSLDRSDPLRPVVVVAGQGRLRADIARFDVLRTGDEICVTCVSGTLALEHPQRRLTLSAGQQLVYDNRGTRTVAQVDTSVVTAWRRGMLVFKGVPLAQVVDEINRYRHGKLILRNLELSQRPMRAQFDIADLDTAIPMICKVTGAHATELPGNIVLLS